MKRIDDGHEFHPAYDRITDAYVALDAHERFTQVNARAGQMFGRRPDELIGRHIWTEFPEQAGGPAHVAYAKAMVEQQPVTIEQYYPPYDSWLENRIYPSADGLTVYFFDITQRKCSEQLDAGQRDILAAIATQQPLAECLERIVWLHEKLNPGALCSLLVMDAEGRHVLHGAAPSLPDEYNQAIHGLEIGDEQGSCGTAAWRRERVVVADIATHPYWRRYRDLALAHGLRSCWSTPVLASDGRVLGTFAVYYRNVREPRREELDSIDKMLPITSIAIEGEQVIQRLRERDRFFDLSLEIYCIFDTRTQRIIQANATFSRVTGYSAEQLAAQHYGFFVHPDDRELVANAVEVLNASGRRVHEVVYRFRCRDGSYRWVAWESAVGPDGLAFAVGRDVTEQRRIEAELAHAASHDVVTSLPHHLVLEGALATLLEDATRPVWVLFIGLDRFHAVNESMGYLVGNDVLQIMARRLHDIVAEGGDIARFAGDEFVVTLSGVEQPAVLAMADRLRQAIALPIEGEDYRLRLTASVGISHSPDHGRRPQELLYRAEAAMSRAKRQGRDAVCEFSVEQMQDIEDRLLLGRHVRGAMGRGEMALHYQPQRRATDGALTGFEALLRWNNPALGRVAPVRFIPIAEALGLMPEIGQWVVEEACRQARCWLDRGHSGFYIAVNISAQELHPCLAPQIGEALRRHELPPHVLSIELTESSLMENVVRVRATLAALKLLGVRLSLDDFGTGYSSLAYLKHFPIDKLKIDQSFVRGLPEDADDAAIARTIVAMAHQLRMVVSAEGVETQAQALFLSGIGCDELQGYHLGRPVSADEAEAFFDRGVRKSAFVDHRR